MKLPSSVVCVLDSQGGMISSRDVGALGLSRTMLGRYVRNGLLVRVSRGVYVVPSAIPDELFALSRQCDRFVFSHATAAFLHGMSDRTPFDHTVSIRSTQTISRALRAKLTCFYVKDAIFSLGQANARTQFGNVVPCYDMERTICDMVRDRARVDDETFLSVIKNYASSGKKDLSKLGHYAEVMGLSRKISSLMEFAL